MVFCNCELFVKCDELQYQFDEWYCDYEFGQIDVSVYKVYFEEIGYLQFEGGDFQVDVDNVDFEIVMILGLQFVVLVFNVWFCINVVNVCWQLFYDVFYGMDVIFEGEGMEKGMLYNLGCGKLVEVYVECFFDEIVLFDGGFYSEVMEYCIMDGFFYMFEVIFQNGVIGGFQNLFFFVGYVGMCD